jgi:hypothetical protein
MSSERQVGRGLAGALLALLMTVAGNVAADAPTWRGLDQLTDDERAQLDFATNTPRDAKLDYLPAEPWPFKAPYTAEEMGYRAAEFVHISRWPHSLVDVFGPIKGPNDSWVGLAPYWLTAPTYSERGEQFETYHRGGRGNRRPHSK